MFTDTDRIWRRENYRGYRPLVRILVTGYAAAIEAREVSGIVKSTNSRYAANFYCLISALRMYKNKN